MKKMSNYSLTEPESIDKPFGAFKNETSPGTKDGTQATAEHMQDLYYPLYQVLQLAGVEPNGILEDGNNNKQFLSALGNIAPVLYVETSVYNKNALVVKNENDVTYVYKSLIAENTSDLSDVNSWIKVLQINADGSIDFAKPIKDKNVEILLKRMDGIFTGENLVEKHAEEINSEYNGDEWAWIQARIKAVNYDGIHIGDYIPVQLSGGTIGGEVVIPANQQHYMQVAGIDTYYNSGDTPIPHHIDFFALNTIEACSTWNDGNTNNGTAAEPNPWLSSKIYAICNGVNNYTTSAQGNLKHGLNCSSGGILQMLPRNCQNVLINVRSWVEEQYSASAQTVQPTGNKWADIGKIIIPHEVEVCGYQPNSYNRGEAGNIDNLTRNLTKMYPLFREQTRVKLGANTQARSNYWLRCPSGGASTLVCFVSGGGRVSQDSATRTTISVCFGFRIG